MDARIEMYRKELDERAEAVPLTLSLLKQITNDFSEENIIGMGGYSTVYKSNIQGRLPNGSCIAVKRISNDHTIDDRIFHNEVDITIKAAHRNIVRLIGYCFHTHEERMRYEGNHIWVEVRQRLICLEYMPNGSLDRYITDKFQEGLDWNQRYQILKGICQALSYLHDQVHVIHGDIKPATLSSKLFASV